MSQPPNFYLRSATPQDVGLLLAFIQELAAVEEFPHPVTVTESDLSHSLFGPAPAAEALIGMENECPVGFAVFYETFSTTTGRRRLHLDDLFVRPKYQSRGYGRMILKHLAAIASNRHCARFEWWALKSNEQALQFFEHIGAQRMLELVIHRVQGTQLQQLAGGEA